MNMKLKLRGAQIPKLKGKILKKDSSQGQSSSKVDRGYKYISLQCKWLISTLKRLLKITKKNTNQATRRIPEYPPAWPYHYSHSKK